MRISCCYCICWVGISWGRPDLDFNNSRLFSDICEDYIGPAFESRYPAYQNMFGQNILWYLLRVMRCDKFIRSTSIINYTHKNNVWEPDDWLKEVRGRLTWWKAWAHQCMGESISPPIPWGKAWAHHDAAPVGLTRERGESIYAAAHHAARWSHPWSALLSRANLGHTTGTESAMLLYV